MKKIVIVGAGVSGLTLAIKVKNDNNEVILLEKNEEVGKKILASGNGRCNFLNDNLDSSFYHTSSSFDLSTIINGSSKKEVLDFINELGIEYKIKNGYYYPFTNKAITMRDTLLSEAIRKGVSIIYKYEVNKIEKDGNDFIINNDIKCDYLVLSTGSKSGVKNSNGYELVKSLGHSVTNLYPSLVQVTANGNYFKKLKGVRTDVLVSLYSNNKLIKEEYGELQFTVYGISGICVFNLSRYVNTMENTSIKINFIPFVTEDVISYLDKKNLNDLTVYDLLSRILNEIIVKALLDLLNIKYDTKYNDIDKELLGKNLTNFMIDVTGTNSFDSSQVTAGGVSINEVNMNTFESKIVDNLYILGELLDIDGDCGGYNISFAILSALRASTSIGDKND